jgi:hypothetical protein
MENSNMFKDIDEANYEDESMNDDLVNISSEGNLDEGVYSKIRPTVFKEYRGGFGESMTSNSDISKNSGVSKMLNK